MLLDPRGTAVKDVDRMLKTREGKEKLERIMEKLEGEEGKKRRKAKGMLVKEVEKKYIKGAGFGKGSGKALEEAVVDKQQRAQSQFLSWLKQKQKESKRNKTMMKKRDKQEKKQENERVERNKQEFKKWKAAARKNKYYTGNKLKKRSKVGVNEKLLTSRPAWVNVINENEERANMR